MTTAFSKSSFSPRVAFVTGGVVVGGATTFLCNLAGEMVRRNVPVEVLSFENDNPLAADFERLKISLFCADEKRFIFEDRMRFILGALRAFNPTVVVANLGPSSFETLRYLPEGIFRVGIVHADDPNVYGMASHYIAHLDLIAAVSETIKTNLEKIPAYSGVPIRYLPLGVPMPKKELSPTSRGNRPLRILYLGRLAQEQKRVRLFPQILAGLNAAKIPFEWTIAGDGPEAGYLKQMMKADRADQKIIFTGKVDYTDVPGLVQDKDIFLLASDYEGLPLSLLEAMGSGLVPVVSDLPSGIHELIDDTTGFLVALNNVKGFSDAIIYLNENREKLEQFSRNAQAKVLTNFSVSAMADRWIAMFSEVKNHEAQWPKEWIIKPLLLSKRPFYHSAPMQFVRRLSLKLRP